MFADVHWSHGSLGYFLTYSLGNLYAAQSFQAAKKNISKLKTEIGNGKPVASSQLAETKYSLKGRFLQAGNFVDK
jgi:carboxypeptidase Taq